MMFQYEYWLSFLLLQGTSIGGGIDVERFRAISKSFFIGKLVKSLQTLPEDDWSLDIAVGVCITALAFSESSILLPSIVICVRVISSSMLNGKMNNTK